MGNFGPGLLIFESILQSIIRVSQIQDEQQNIFKVQTPIDNMLVHKCSTEPNLDNPTSRCMNFFFET